VFDCTFSRDSLSDEGEIDIFGVERLSRM
jgi:hypothetical protein